MNGENYYSGFERNHFDEYAQNGFNELLDISPESYVVDINDQKLKAIIQQTTKDNILQILGNENSFEAGDIVNHKNEKYLIMLKPQFNQMYQKSKMEMCNIDLKWIDDKGEIKSYPSVFYFNTRSNFGVEEDKTLSLPDGRRQTVLPENEDTVKLKRDARFIIGGEAFKVIDNDYVSDQGLVNLSFKSDSINTTTDNVELGIADYHKLAKYEISISNGEMLAIKVGDTLQLNVKTTKNGTPVEIPLLFSSSDDSIATVSDTGLVFGIQKGSCSIQVSGKGVSASIDLNIIEDLTPNYTAEIIGEDSIYNNRTSTYTVTFRNNGSEVADTSRFWITALDGKSTDLAVIESQNFSNGTCVVKSNNNRKLGTFTLHVENSNGLSTGKKDIRVKSLI
ncbi:Ig-like domain-containing protein [Paenibacillus taichungensis]